MRTISFSLAVLINIAAYAQWSPDASVNNAVCNFTGSQTSVQMISDGAGGAICAWVDTRNGTQDIYAQRIAANGTLLWMTDGIAICNATADQFSPKLASDGAGGAVIAWYDNRAGNYDMYAQKINTTGTVQWAIDGVPVCTIAGNQNAHQLMADGSGGAFIVWSDGRGGGPNADIYAQRINASGAVQWTVDGVSVCNASSLQNIPQIVTDGAGGAIIAWEDWRNFSQPDIYAQRITSGGFPNWTFNGIVICSEGNFGNQYNTRMVSDGSGGAIMCWLDNRNFGSNTDIYAQKVNASGVTQWLTNGLAVCIANAIQVSQQIISDGAGGAIVVWEDRRTDRDIYTQRLNTSGAIQWTANGIVVCNAIGIQEEPQLAARSSGAVFLWTDSRNGSQQDIYVQGIDATGTSLWSANGVAVATESHSQSAAQLISDGADGAIIAWQDLRTTLDYDIYSSKLFSNGTLPVRLFDFTLLNNFNTVALQWKTDNEINNRGFEIQRSGNGSSWHSIGFVDASVAGALIKNYRWDDYTPLPGKSFYRLKQIDNDNRFEYTIVLSISRSAVATMSVHPNPARGTIHVNFARLINNGNLQLYNSTGQMIVTQTIASRSSLQLDVKHLPAGIYTLYMRSEEGNTACKLMVANQ